MKEFDLDANRAAREAARSEEENEPKVVTFGGTKFELPAKLSAAFAFALAEFQPGAACKALFGDQYEDFMALSPELDDIVSLLEGVAGLYGLAVGESKPSAKP